MILLGLGIYFRLVSTSTAIAPHLPLNVTINNTSNTGHYKAIPVFIESVFNKLNSSNLAAIVERAVVTKKPQKIVQFSDELEISDVSDSLKSFRRAKRHAPEESNLTSDNREHNTGNYKAIPVFIESVINKLNSSNLAANIEPVVITKESGTTDQFSDELEISDVSNSKSFRRARRQAPDESNVTIVNRNHNTGNYKAIPVFIESVFNKFNSSNLAENLEPEAITKKSGTTDQFSLEPEVSDVSYYLKFRRARRQAPEENISSLPRWPGMPRGVLRNNDPQVPLIQGKILGMMLQCMYGVQDRLWPMEKLAQQYSRMAPYRMAFIYLKLDQLVHEAHSIRYYIERQSAKLQMTKRLQLYSQLMRRHIDVTYLVDYISERVTQAQMVRTRAYVIRKEQEALMKRWNEFQRTSQAPPA